MTDSAVAHMTPVEQLPLAPAASESAAILSVIERMATNPDIDPDRIERFIALKERMDREAAVKAFNAAITAAKAEIKPIARKSDGHNGKYADLATIAEAVDPILSRHGLNYRHKTAQTNEAVSVTCVLSHELGHAEETTLSAGADDSGKKNSIQAIGSTQTYLMRYTLVSALGLATTKDDDGAAAGAAATISDQQVMDLRDLIESVAEQVNSTIPVYTTNFLKFMKVDRIEDIAARDYQKAINAINSTRTGK